MKLITLPTASETGPHQKLMDEMRNVVLRPDYDMLPIAGIIGVLEMLKLEMYERDGK